MADKKISELTSIAGASLDKSTDVIPVVDTSAGETKKITVSELFIGGSDFDEDITVNDVTVGRGSGDVSANTVLGNGALENNTTGINNVANGYQALFNNTTGGSNVASGFQALFDNATGRQQHI